MSTGKWAQADVPHRGWSCVDAFDLEEPSQTCEMCEVQQIRYVHVLEHPDYPDRLEVGCVCAEHMEEDYNGPQERERRLRGIAARRKNWTNRQWHHEFDWRVGRISADWYTNVAGHKLEVRHVETGGWRLRVTHRESERYQVGKKIYPTDQDAKRAGLDALLWMQQRAAM